MEVEQLRAVAEEVVAGEESEQVLARFRQWWNMRDLERPLVVLLGGVTGVGKSTVATQLAGRLGFVHVIATDQVRQVVRAFFSHEFLPSVHHSSFDVAARALRRCPRTTQGTVAGFLRRSTTSRPGVDALVERAVSDRTPMVLEGVHLLPDLPSPRAAGSARHGAGADRRARPGGAPRVTSTRAARRRCGRRSATWRRSTGSGSCRTI